MRKSTWLAAVWMLAGSGAGWAAPPTVTMGAGGLVYTTDDMGNRIIDFSSAGYMGGGVAIPTVANKVVLSAVSGDNTASIQNALNSVGTMAPDAHGLRGAVFLNPGAYEVDGTLTIGSSGVVLRGAGAGTVLTFPGGVRQVILVHGASGVSGTGSTFKITDTYVPVGATTVHLSGTSGLAVGNLVSFHRPWTQAWIDAMAMTAYWTTKTGPGFERSITAISGAQITLDTPLPTPFELTYLQGTVQKATETGRIQQCGVESMHLVAAFPTNNISDAAVDWTNCKNCWGKNLISDGFGNGFIVDSGSKWVTVQDCTYENGYNNGSARPFAFDCNGQFVLFQRCVGVSGFAHIVATQDSTPGPNVFLNITAMGSNNFDGGPHQRWAMSVLMDNVGGTISTLKIYNAMAEGTGHGWVAGSSICYNCTPVTITVQQPALAYNYNYIMGGTGKVNSVTTPGTYVSTGTILAPKSLYLEQLKERVGTQAVQNIGFPRFSGNFKILAVNSGQAAGGATAADGAAVVQNPFSGSTGQQWQFVDVGGGYFEIKNAASAGAMAVQGGAVVQTAYTGAAAMQWLVTDLPGNACEMVNRGSGSALDVPGGSGTPGIQLNVAVYSGGTNQQFQIVPLQ